MACEERRVGVSACGRMGVSAYRRMCLFGRARLPNTSIVLSKLPASSTQRFSYTDTLAEPGVSGVNMMNRRPAARRTYWSSIA